MAEIDYEHPSFTLAKSLPPPWRDHFAKSHMEVKSWRPIIQHYGLDIHVLVVATTRIECAWCAYIGAVSGENHYGERGPVLSHGSKLPEHIARAMFTNFELVPYAN